MGKNRLFPEKSADELLREFVSSGAQAPFEEIVRRYAGMVYSVCYRVTSNSHDAEDATQAVFLSLALQAKTGKPIHYIGPWLQRVAHRLALDVKKSKTRRKNREEKLAEMNGNGRLHAPADPANAPVDDELKRLMTEELNQMPAKYRMPLILHYFGGMNREEMARELNCKPATLGVRVHRGRAMLGKRLAKRGVVIGAALPFMIEHALHASIPTGLIENTTRSVLISTLSGSHDGYLPALAATRVISIARIAAKAVMYAKVRAAVAIVLVLSLTSAFAGPTVIQSVKELKLHLVAPFDLNRIIKPLLKMVTPQLRADATSDQKKQTETVVVAKPVEEAPALTVPPVEPMRLVVAGVATSAQPQAAGDIGRAIAAPKPVEVSHHDPIENIGEFLRLAPAPRAESGLPVGSSNSSSSSVAIADASVSRSTSSTSAEAPPIDASGRLTLGGGGGGGSGPAPSKFELTDNRTIETKQSIIGDTGFGYFRQTTGRHKVDGDLVLGNQKGSKGVYDLAGGQLTAAGAVIGNAGEATFNQTSGTAEVEKLAIGKETSGIGTYILAGDGLLKGGQVTVAVSGTGTLDQQGGTIALAAGASTYRSYYFADESMQPATLDVAQNGAADGNLVMRDGILLFRSGQSNPALRVGVGGDGTLTVGGDKVSPAIIEDKNVQTNLVVRAYPSGRGVLKGWGNFLLTGDLIMNGKVQADGFNAERTLDLSHFSGVDNRIENPIDGGTNGWVAKRKGALLLPPVPVTKGTGTYNWGEAPTDNIIDLVNSVQFTVHDATYPGEVSISLLSTDRDDIPTLPSIHRFIGVWSFDDSDIDAKGGFDITVRYNDVLAKSLGIREELLKFWAYEDGGWTRIRDETFHRDLTKNLIGAHFDHATFFAVSAPEPSGISFLLIAGAALVLRRRRSA